MMVEPLEAFWDHILSRDSERIKVAFEAINEQEQSAVLAHLKRMASEPDWHPEQVRSSKTALNAITKTPNEIS